MILRLACVAAAVIAVILFGQRSDSLPDRRASVRAEPVEARRDLGRGIGAQTPTLQHGSASADELIQRFLRALAANDRVAIERLRVDESEYRNLIMPGSVQPGSAPRLMPEHKSLYFWRQHNTRSAYSLNALMKEYGGKRFRLKDAAYTRVEQFAVYSAHRDPVLRLESSAGESFELQLGSIAEHDGRYKFISYHSD